MRTSSTPFRLCCSPNTQPVAHSPVLTSVVELDVACYIQLLLADWARAVCVCSLVVHTTIVSLITITITTVSSLLTLTTSAALTSSFLCRKLLHTSLPHARLNRSSIRSVASERFSLCRSFNCNENELCSSARHPSNHS